MATLLVRQIILRMLSAPAYEEPWDALSTAATLTGYVKSSGPYVSLTEKHGAQIYSH